VSRRFSACLCAAAAIALLPTAATAKGIHTPIDPNKFASDTTPTQAVNSTQLKEELKRAQLERFTLTPSTDTLTVGQTATVELIMRPGRRLIEMIATATPAGSPPSQPQVTGVMKADLDGGFAFAVTPDEPVQKGVRAHGDTDWNWSIRALEQGVQKLTARLTTPVMFEGTLTDVDVRDIDLTIVVIPVPPATIPVTAQVLNFLGDNWQWLWAAILVPCAGWLWKRRQSKARQSGAR
jgi:hypothetical protein